jgi:predicted RND superfamily exporter protein
MKINKVIILVVICVICLVSVGVFIFRSTADNEFVDSKVETEVNDNQQPTSNNYYDLDNIKNVVVAVAKANVTEPEMIETTVTNKDEIKNILSNIDSAVFVEAITGPFGYMTNTTITINYNNDPSTKIIILANGNIAMDRSVGAGDGGYAQYSLSNKEFESELFNKYGK